MDIPTIQSTVSRELLTFKRLQLGTVHTVCDMVTLVISGPKGEDPRSITVATDKLLEGIRHECPDSLLTDVKLRLVELRDENRRQLRESVRAQLNTDFREGKESAYVDALELLEKELQR